MIGCDPAFVALPALAASAAAIGSTRVISPKTGWDEPAAIWAVTVGRSGTGKSPALVMVEKGIDEIDEGLADEYVKDREAFERECEAWQKSPDDERDRVPKPRPPVRQRFRIQDTTIEALLGTLEENPRGVLVARDELAGWLNSFTKYGNRGGASDLPSWLSLFNRGTVVYTRKTGDRRDIRVCGVCVSVAGTIQPKVLKARLTTEEREAGLLARLLLAMPPVELRQWTEAEVPESVVAQFEDKLRELRQLRFDTDRRGRRQPRRLMLSAAAKKEFIDFYNRNGEQAYHASDDEAAARSKMEAYALRFALVFHCVRHGDAGGQPDEVAAVDMANAIQLTDWFITEASRVYRMLGETAEEESDRKLVELVRRLATKSTSGRVTPRELNRSNSARFPDCDAAERALDRLVQADLAVWVDRPPGDRGGRSSRAVQLLQQPDRVE